MTSSSSSGGSEQSLSKNCQYSHMYLTSRLQEVHCYLPCVCSTRIVTVILGDVLITKYLHVYQIAHFCDAHIVTNRNKNKED